MVVATRTSKRKHSMRVNKSEFLKHHFGPNTLKAIRDNIGKLSPQLNDLHMFINTFPDWRMKILKRKGGGLRGLERIEKFAFREGLINERRNRDSISLRGIPSGSICMLRALTGRHYLAIDDLKHISKTDWRSKCWSVCSDIKIIEGIEALLRRNGLIDYEKKYVHGRFSVCTINFLKRYFDKKFPTLDDIDSLVRRRTWKHLVRKSFGSNDTVIKELMEYKINY